MSTRDEEITARLAAALEGSAWWHQRLDIADVLLPSVREIADQRAAEELAAAARDLRESAVFPVADYYARHLEDRAAVLLRGEA